MTPITVRFSEREEYDINIDADVVQMMATTNKGSYWARFAVDGVSLREMRARFKSRTIEAIQRGADPCEIGVGEEMVS